MRTATLLDTSIATDNLGDEIIMEAVRLELLDIMPDVYFYTVPTHDTLGRRAHKILKRSEFGIVGGTNIMSSRLLRGANWKLNPIDLPFMKDIVVMGVGWMDYMAAPTRYARFIYERILSSRYLHSARDEYSRGRIAQVRSNVVNTACPTMWRLTPDHCASLPVTKAPDAVVALTYYRPDRAADTALLDLVTQAYDKVYFWIQQAEDLDYARSLGNHKLIPLPPSVPAYSNFLDTTDVDFIGSRLHGGIRALQSKRRSLILSIDNRAREIGRDTGLPVVERTDTDAVAKWLGGSAPITVDLPSDSIRRWREQFAA